MAKLKIRFDKRALATIRQGIKDVRAGRIVSHGKTARWLRSWGKKRELPPPSRQQRGTKLSTKSIETIGPKKARAAGTLANPPRSA